MLSCYDDHAMIMLCTVLSKISPRMRIAQKCKTVRTLEPACDLHWGGSGCKTSFRHASGRVNTQAVLAKVVCAPIPNATPVEDGCSQVP